MSENAEQLNKKAFEVANGSSFSRVSDEEVLRVLTTLDSGVRPDLSRRFYRIVKRAFDIVASGAALLVLFVPGLILSVAICVKSPGASPLYNQMRVGRLRKDGTCKLFRMWKFRSMVPNADELLDELRERNEADGPLFRANNDGATYRTLIGWSGLRFGVAKNSVGTKTVRIFPGTNRSGWECRFEVFCDVSKLDYGAKKMHWRWLSVC